MGDLVPFPGRKNARRRAPRVQRRRVEWRAYSPSTGSSIRLGNREDAQATVEDANASSDTPDWRVERRTVGDWEQP